MRVMAKEDDMHMQLEEYWGCVWIYSTCAWCIQLLIRLVIQSPFHRHYSRLKVASLYDSHFALLSTIAGGADQKDMKT